MLKGFPANISTCAPHAFGIGQPCTHDYVFSPSLIESVTK